MMIVPDSKTEHPDFFCNGCQRHKKGRLYSHGTGRRKTCTTCAMPMDERLAMGIRNPYENLTTQKDPIPITSKKPISSNHRRT